jgi:small subunit ribosomal protein S9
MADTTAKQEEATEEVVAAVAAPVHVVDAKAAKKLKKDEYVYAVGRRKNAIAKTRLWMDGKGEVTVNDRKLKEYFPTFEYQEQVMAPLRAVGFDESANVALTVSGGGLRGQAEASRLGISRALLVFNPTYRGSLKPLGYLTRDARKKERKKPGLKKARKASQWAKR